MVEERNLIPNCDWLGDAVGNDEIDEIDETGKRWLVVFLFLFIFWSIV